MATKCFVNAEDYREHFDRPVKPREPNYFGKGYRPRGRYALKRLGSGYVRTDADAIPRKDPK